MNRFMSGPMSRFAAVLLLLIVGAGTWAAFVEPLSQAVGRRSSDLVAASEQLEGYRQRAAAKPRLERALAELREQAGKREGLLIGDNPTLIAAKLQGDVNRMVTSRRGTVTSMLTVPPADAGGFLRIALQADFTIPAMGLAQVLDDIQSAMPFLFVENLAIRSSEAVTAPGEPGREPALTVRAEIQGYARKSRS